MTTWHSSIYTYRARSIYNASQSVIVKAETMNTPLIPVITGSPGAVTPTVKQRKPRKTPNYTEAEVKIINAHKEAYYAAKDAEERSVIWRRKLLPDLFNHWEQQKENPRKDAAKRTLVSNPINMMKRNTRDMTLPSRN